MTDIFRGHWHCTALSAHIIMPHTIELKWINTSARHVLRNNISPFSLSLFSIHCIIYLWAYPIGFNRGMLGLAENPARGTGFWSKKKSPRCFDGKSQTQEVKMAVRERVDSAQKQADFVHLNVSQEQLLSKHCFQWWLGKTNDCSEYSKVKNAICKHARLSKQIGPVGCNASSVVCRAMSSARLIMLGCDGGLSARPTNRSVTA